MSISTPTHTPAALRLASASALAITLAAALLAGCGSTSLTEPNSIAPVESRTLGAANAAAGATPGATPQSSVNTVDLSTSAGAGAAGTASMSAPSQRLVYFDFDSFAIRDEYKSVVENHAKVLTTARAKKLVIEGHTDERGGREYNLALGQKRAESVARSLELLGVNGGQIEAVSFGKERPAVQGIDEAAWARNRRAELKDR